MLNSILLLTVLHKQSQLTIKIIDQNEKDMGRKNGMDDRRESTSSVNMATFIANFLYLGTG